MYYILAIKDGDRYDIPILSKSFFDAFCQMKKFLDKKDCFYSLRPDLYEVALIGLWTNEFNYFELTTPPLVLCSLEELSDTDVMFSWAKKKLEDVILYMKEHSVVIKAEQGGTI